MNIDNVCTRLMMLSGLDADEILKWRTTVEDACGYVLSLSKTDSPDDGQLKRLELLAAAYALYLFELSGGTRVNKLTAGEVRLELSSDGAADAARLWKELSAHNADLIRTEDFLFGRVM